MCDKVFPKDYRTSVRHFKEITKYCSRVCLNNSKLGNKNRLGISFPAWNKGKKELQVAWNKGNGEYARKLGFGKWMTGKKQAVGTRLKKSLAAKKAIAEGRHNFYIDGRTPENNMVRHSIEYRLWREAVFARDNFTCQECKVRGGELHAHHIKPFATHPELRMAIDNGQTLCILCHQKTFSYRSKAVKV